MSGVVVIGAGGHGKVVADILLCCGINILGFLDDNHTLWNTQIIGFPVLGSITEYQNYGCNGFALGVGSNKVRREIVERLGNPSESLWMNAVHPSAVVSSSVRIGHGVVIAAQAVVNPDTHIGNFSIVNTSASVDHDCIIGDFAHIAPGSHIAGDVTVGQGVLMGIGSKAIPGRSIGDWAVIGAGATVVQDIPANVIAKGTPARW